MKNVALYNLGCKVNSYETEGMRQALSEKGYNIVPFDEKADIYIVNTCTVTNIADRKSRQILHRAKQLNPRAVVVAVGCYVQTGQEAIQKDDSIDLAVGNNRKKDIAEILEEFLNTRGLSEKSWEEPDSGQAEAFGGEPDSGQAESSGGEPNSGQAEAFGEASNSGQAESSGGEPNSGLAQESEKAGRAAGKRDKTLHGTTILDIHHTYEYEEMQVRQTGEHTRAYIKIQDGCNQFCSYCAIPYARGRVRSRLPEDIIREIQGLAEAGYREVVLTGIHISSYGIDFPKAEERKDLSLSGEYRGVSRLIDLTEQIHEIQGLDRIRLGSLEPRIITPETARRLAALPKLCPHFHLSLQSGCDITLKRMNRHYTAGEYYNSVESLRKYYDAPAVTTDVIVGFPGETEEEFACTKAFLDKVGFYEMHIFKYSRRAGTAADRMPDQVPDQVKTRRSGELLALERQMSREFRKRYIGREAEVLLEERQEVNGRSFWVGHTKDYVKVAVEDGPGELRANLLIRVPVKGFLTDEILN